MAHLSSGAIPTAFSKFKRGMRIALLGLSGAALPLAVLAEPQIKDDAEIFYRLKTTAIANEIQQNCDTIAARKIAATFFVLGILYYAKRQGFTSDQIDAYKQNPVEQERLRSATYNYLDTHAVNRTERATYCVLGRAEISNQSQIGKLLKSR